MSHITCSPYADLFPQKDSKLPIKEEIYKELLLIIEDARGQMIDPQLIQKLQSQIYNKILYYVSRGDIDHRRWQDDHHIVVQTAHDYHRELIEKHLPVTEVPNSNQVHVRLPQWLVDWLEEDE